jgi:hypothetical protein
MFSGLRSNPQMRPNKRKKPGGRISNVFRIAGQSADASKHEKETRRTDFECFQDCGAIRRCYNKEISEG